VHRLDFCKVQDCNISCFLRAGEPRDMRDPANAPFMNSIARGECPRELEPRDSSQPVNVNLVRVRFSFPGLSR